MLASAATAACSFLKNFALTWHCYLLTWSGKFSTQVRSDVVFSLTLVPSFLKQLDWHQGGGSSGLLPYADGQVAVTAPFEQPDLQRWGHCYGSGKCYEVFCVLNVVLCERSGRSVLFSSCPTA